MDTATKKQLALEGRSDVIAAALRVKAARRFVGMSQEDLAEAIDRGKQAINNIERARNFPNWQLMVYLQAEHRVNVDFIVAGSFSQLPSDVQDGLFDALAEIIPSSDLLTG